ncbi:MAG: SGNH/GDSL hydrolase family protein [Bulleidia sp.]
MRRALWISLILCMSAGCQSTPASVKTEPANTTCRTMNYYSYDQPVQANSKVDDTWFSDALIIGDSRVGSLALYSDLASYGAEIIYDETMGVFNFTSLPMQMSNSTPWDILLKSDRQKIYLWLGINEIRYDFTDWAVVYDRYVREIRTSHPEAQIYLIGSYYPKSISGLSSEQLKEQVDTQNALIQKTAKDNQVYFIDLNPDLCKDNMIQDEYVWGDYALNVEGAQEVMKLLEKYAVKEEDYVKTVCE